MRIRSALTLAAATAGIVTMTTGTASASPTSSDAAPAPFIMVTSTAFCGTTPDGHGWERVSLGDWGSMEFMPSNYSLDPSKLKKGKYYSFTIDANGFIVYDIQEAKYPAYGRQGCDRIGA